MTSFSEYRVLQEQYIAKPNTQYGSNDGGLYTHQPSGQVMYVKFPKNEEQARVEAATADLYNAMGIRTLNPRVKQIDGKTALVTKWNPDVESFKRASQYHDLMSNTSRELELAKIHHAAIISGNRDVVGLDYSNVMQDKSTGELVSADQGGSMHFRAQGEPKVFDSSVADIHSFQNPAYQSGRVFSKVSPSAFKDATSSVHKLTDDVIDSVMTLHGLQHHAQTVKNRRDALIKFYQTEQ